MCGTPVVATGVQTPAATNTMYPKDVAGAEPVNLSQVSGIVVHSAGDLLLLQIPMLPATGMGNTTPRTPDKTLAVIRMPSGCSTSIADGTSVKAVFMSTTDGIMKAETVQATQ